MKILVVGAGSIGQRHFSNLCSIGSENQISIVDPAIENCRTLGQQVDRYVAHFSSLELALEKDNYDVAFVCSPNEFHVTQAIALAQAGCDLFVEKPIALDQVEAHSLEPVLERTGVSLMVGCNLRFHPGVQKLAEVLNSGRIGRPLFAKAQFGHYLPNWRPTVSYADTYSAQRTRGGGILLDSIHEPDYLCWLLGPAISASGILSSIGDLLIDVEDSVEYMIWHTDSIYSQVHADYLRRDKFRGCELVGTEGTVVWQSKGRRPETIRVDLFDADLDRWETVYRNDRYDPNSQYLDEVSYFLDCVVQGKRPFNGLEEAIASMRLIDQVRNSSSPRISEKSSHEKPQ